MMTVCILPLQHNISAQITFIYINYRIEYKNRAEQKDFLLKYTKCKKQIFYDINNNFGLIKNAKMRKKEGMTIMVHMERDRERERGRECVCLCLYVRARERERERG